jgi:hypothetical protein
MGWAIYQPSGVTVESDPLALKIGANLSDLSNFVTARSNLGVPASADVMLLDGTQPMSGNLDLANNSLEGASSVALLAGADEYSQSIVGAGLQVRRENPGAASVIDIVSSDQDGTDFVELAIFGVGNRLSSNFEAGSFLYNRADGTIDISSVAFGTGIIRPLTFLFNDDGVLTRAATIAPTGHWDFHSKQLQNISTVEVDGGSNTAPFTMFEGRTDTPVFKSSKSGSAAFWCLYTADFDGTDNNNFRLYGKASIGPTAAGNDHFTQLNWDVAQNTYRLGSLAAGTEVPQALQVTIGNNLAVDAVKANPLLLLASNKSFGTGDGGDLVLKAGSSAGGLYGSINMRRPNQPTADTDALKFNFVNASDRWDITRNDTSNTFSFLGAGGFSLNASLNMGNNSIVAANEVEIDGALNHDGALIGEYGAAPTAQSAAIADAAGGGVIDAEARAAINALLAYFRLRGTIAP